MTTLSIRLPDDMAEKLKKIAKELGNAKRAAQLLGESCRLGNSF
ncbi:MAG: ribbon-helix-helix protein, CopG family [Methylobacter sp.]